MIESAIPIEIWQIILLCAEITARREDGMKNDSPCGFEGV